MKDIRWAIVIVVALYISCVICVFVTAFSSVQDLFDPSKDYGYYLIFITLIGSGLVGMVAGWLIDRSIDMRNNTGEDRKTWLSACGPLLFGILFFVSITMGFLFFGMKLWVQSLP